MRNLSSWAFHHPWMARITITISSVILSCLALLLGCLSYDEAYTIPPVWTWVLAVFILLACAIYPQKKNAQYKAYRRRKAMDVLLATCSFLLLAFASNQYVAPNRTVQQGNAFGASSYAATSISKPGKPAFRQQKRMAKQWLKALREKYKKASPATKALLIFLTVLAAAGLILLVAALACGIACSSSEALALIVLLLGVTGVVLLARLVILRIRNGPKPKPLAEPASSL